VPRRLKLVTVELGELELYFIYSVGGVYEPSWSGLSGWSGCSLFTVMSLGVVMHALHGWTQPLVKGLGISPSGALRKVGVGCRDSAGCIFRGVDCHARGKVLPVCYVPPGVVVGELGYEVIRMWREGVYVIVVDGLVLEDKEI
jgi:hypothetical protein